MLALPNCDLDWLHRRVANFAEDRPGIYQMKGPSGRVIYVGKAKRVRTRLLSYFRAAYPEDKAARILHAAADIDWKYVSSEFAALLGELEAIRRHRPMFNVRMNRTRRTTLVKIVGGSAPKIFVGSRRGGDEVRHYGPLPSPARAREAIKTLNDLLGLRDCAQSMPMCFAEQGDLFATPRRAACLRHELGSCTGPCAGLVTADEYGRRVDAAVDFLEGRSVAPIRWVVEQMTAVSDGNDFERAAWWRERYDALEWLLGALSRARAAIEALSFVYLDPGAFGDDRVYLIRHATVRAVAPAPRTPIEREAFSAQVAEHAGGETEVVPLPPTHLDEMLLLTSWFRTHPTALQRTTPLDEWTDAVARADR